MTKRKRRFWIVRAVDPTFIHYFDDYEKAKLWAQEVRYPWPFLIIEECTAVEVERVRR